MKRLFAGGRWEGYRPADLRKDLIAGLTVGVIAIPLGMAFAIASGVRPEYGLYTTIFAGIIIAILGGSRFQVGGPTGAFIPILLAIVLQYGYENLLIAGLMAGVLLLMMGVFKLGAAIKYIPRPVTIGFTTGIAVIIFTGQIQYFLGLSGLERHESFISNIQEIASHLHLVQFSSMMTALVCLAFLIIMTKFFPKIPSSIVGLIASTLVATWLFSGDIPTIGSEFGPIPGTLPTFQWPEITVEKIWMLLGPAVTIALLGAIESLLSAVVADGMSGTRHDSNRELIGQGVANIVAPLFGGIPATGAIARTATNIKSGAVSPLSSVIHGITVFIVLLLFAPYASQIPLAGMASILMLVAWNMSSRRHFIQLLKMRNSDSLVTLLTFLLTIFINLTAAVGVGLVLAALLFIKRMSELLTVTRVNPESSAEYAALNEMMKRTSSRETAVSIYAVEGPLFFGAAAYFLNTLMDAIQSRPRILLLRMSKMPFIDATGEANLHALVRHLQNAHSIVLVSGLQQQPKDMLINTGLYRLIGEQHFFDTAEEAIRYAVKKLDAA